jgi:hypothetical protein
MKVGTGKCKQSENGNWVKWNYVLKGRFEGFQLLGVKSMQMGGMEGVFK